MTEQEKIEQAAKEIWKDIPGYEGRYQASSLGNIKSLDRLSRSRWGNVPMVQKGGPLSPHLANTGYMMCYLSLGASESGRMKSVHRLVALAFIPNPSNAATVNHINGNKLDNRAVNLEWNTHRSNIKHAFMLGLIERPISLSCEQILAIQKSDNSKTHTQIGKELGISREQVRYIRTGRKERIDVYKELQKEKDRSAALIGTLEKLIQFGGYVATIAAEAVSKYHNPH